MLYQLETGFSITDTQQDAVNKLADGLRSNHDCQTLLGVTGSGKTYTIANLISQVQRPALVMAPNKTLAAQLYSEMKSFFPNNAVEYFVSYYDYYQPEAYVPSSDTFIEKDASINTYIEQMRLSATKSIATRKDTIIVATVSAIYGLGDPETYTDMHLALLKGESVGQRQVMRRLVDMQYKRSKLTLERGQFRVNGDVIDIFPAENDRYALRVMLFDEEVEKLLLFDPLTGDAIQDLTSYTVYPKSHYATPKERIDHTVSSIKEEVKERVKFFESQQKWIEAQRIAQRCKYDIEMMLELGYCNGIENYSRYLSCREAGQTPPTLMDYLPNETLVILDESHVTLPQIRGMFYGDRSRKMNLVEYGFRLPSAMDNRPLNFEEFESLSLQSVFISATPGPYETDHAKQVVELLVRPTGLIDPEVTIRPAGNQIGDVYTEILGCVAKEERVLITTLTKKMAEQLAEYLDEQGIKVRYLHSSIDTVERVEILRDLRLGVFDVLVGINLLREGLDLPEVSLVAILDADKEGFLRSTSALIQTVGRAARHISGRAIMYADKITGSMQRALDEMDRRRCVQRQFNKDNNITPRPIKKAVADILNIGQSSDSSKSQEAVQPTELLTYDQITKDIKKLDKEMYQCVEKLEFEQAAKLRDEIARLKLLAIKS